LEVELGLGGIELGGGAKDQYCDKAMAFDRGNSDRELELLENVYRKTQGDHWTNNTGWMTDASHCEWHGIGCNLEGRVVEIILRDNNVTGKFPASFLPNFLKLEILNLAGNNLSGVTTGNSNGGDDASVFFDLRALTQVDLSQNKLTGEVDVLFAPALVHVNFSHNNFTSVNTYKTFKRSHKTMQIADLSHNFIQEEVDKLMTNLPPNMEQLILSDNQIHGTLPKALENVGQLKKLDLGTNMLSGDLPDFSAPYPNLRVLNLSNQKQGSNPGFIGPISEGLGNLNFLTMLNLSGNSLTSTIPPVLGNMGQLKVLDLSNNQFSKSIPASLGRLEGKSLCSVLLLNSI
jgi:Leucine-rich repeat (LRR) protein